MQADNDNAITLVRCNNKVDNLKKTKTVTVNTAANTSPLVYDLVFANNFSNIFRSITPFTFTDITTFTCTDFNNI